MCKKNETMHLHHELLEDLNYKKFLPDKTMLKWYNNRYSTSKHLLILYSLAIGLNAKNIVEIGFGRSSFVLLKAASVTKGKLTTCDTNNFSALLSDEEKKLSNYINCDANLFWHIYNEPIDFAFLDFFSNANLGEDYSLYHISKCLNIMKQNSIIAIHDTIDTKYKVYKTIKKLYKYNNSGKFNIEIINLPFNYGLSIIKNNKKTIHGKLSDIHTKQQLL